MQDELIRKIAEEIVSETVLGNYKFYLLIFSISALAGGIGAFVGSYLKRRGENLATKSDFIEIARQLKETTTITEEIKSAISSRTAEENALRTLTRQKIELLFEVTFELELWLERGRSLAFRGESIDVNACPISRIEMLQAIYFRELAEETFSLKVATIAMMEWILKISNESTVAKRENRAPAWKNFGDFGDYLKPVLESLLLVRNSLIEKYAKKAGL